MIEIFYLFLFNLTNNNLLLLKYVPSRLDGVTGLKIIILSSTILKHLSEFRIIL